jgi:hypothetical protein
MWIKPILIWSFEMPPGAAGDASVAGAEAVAAASDGEGEVAGVDSAGSQGSQHDQAEDKGKCFFMYDHSSKFILS